jgi:hypothetical protein
MLDTIVLGWIVILGILFVTLVLFPGIGFLVILFFDDVVIDSYWELYGIGLLCMTLVVIVLVVLCGIGLVVGMLAQGIALMF